MNGLDSVRLVDSAFQWCCVLFDAKAKVESNKWAKQLEKVKENVDIVKGLGYEALRQWEDIVMPNYIEDFKNAEQLNGRIYGDALDYVIKMMRDFIETTKFTKDLADYDGEFLYNNTPIQY